MYQIIIKSFKLIFLGFLPLLCISSIDSDQSVVNDFVEDNWLRVVANNTIQELEGNMSFEHTSENFKDGQYFNSLKLRLKSDSGKVPNDVEFTISKENKIARLPVGHYRVNPIDGFINHFDGVFGVANINSMGERPFFAADGTIHITKMEENNVAGRMNMTLSNGDGSIIKIVGKFEAELL